MATPSEEFAGAPSDHRSPLDLGRAEVIRGYDESRRTNTLAKAADIPSRRVAEQQSSRAFGKRSRPLAATGREPDCSTIPSQVVMAAKRPDLRGFTRRGGTAGAPARPCAARGGRGTRAGARARA